MRVTAKGQVTIPRRVREALGIESYCEVDFEPQPDGSYRLVKRAEPPPRRRRLSGLRGCATVKMITDEIMALTRGE
jgi:AbrB family looped-hinge helix DNA binding protein